ncbi:hypothetical protein Tco_1128529 [Tanacetum coccineum]
MPYSRYGINIIFWKISNVVPTPRNPQYTCITRSSTKKLFTPFEDPEQEFCSSRKLFKRPSLDESSSLEFDLFSDLEEHSEEEIAETMTKIMKNTCARSEVTMGQVLLGLKSMTKLTLN